MNYRQYKKSLKKSDGIYLIDNYKIVLTCRCKRTKEGKSEFLKGAIFYKDGIKETEYAVLTYVYPKVDFEQRIKFWLTINSILSNIEEDRNQKLVN